MKILKKLSALILVFSMLASVTVFPVNASSYNDVADNMYYSDAIEALTLYGVVSGYKGSFNPDSYVTRAEFAKMISLVAGLENEIHSSAGNRKFDDVPIGYWGTGYINTAANNKLIVGYPNGYFEPERSITFAEAVTVILRAMDYSTADLGDNWPYAYMVKAAGLGLTDGILLNDNSPITRADLCVIINRALQTDLNHSSQTLISKMDINMTEETLVIATKNEDASLMANQIRTSDGVYKLANTSLKFTPLTKVKLILNDKKEVMNFNTTYVPEKTITSVDGYFDGEVYFADGTSSKMLGVTDSTPVYNAGTITSYGAFKNSIEGGAEVSVVYDENGTVGYLLFNDASYTEAVAVRSNIYTALNSVGVSREMIDAAKVIRNGYAATLDDVELYDVAYYLADNQTIYLYSDKISGVYNEAFPSKANVASIELSGNVLELETQAAAYKLGEKSGSYKLKSRITALLGRDGKVVDIVDLNASGASNYGILLSTGTKMSDDILESGQQTNYFTFINGEGHTINYSTKYDYSEKIGDIGRVSFDDDGNASFSNVSVNASVTGVVDKNNKKIGDHWLTSDCVILERLYAPSTRTGTATAQVIDIEDVTVSELTAKQVLYALTSGDFGDVALLIVENVTKNQYTYGVLKSMSGSTGSIGDRLGTAQAVYEIFTNGTTVNRNASFYTRIDSGVGVAMIMDGTKLVSLKALTKVAAGSKLNAIDFSRVKAGNGTYRMADDVQLIKKTSRNEYISISLDDARSYIGSTVNLFADSAVASGGLIRIVVIN